MHASATPQRLGLPSTASPDGWPLDGEPGLPIHRERGCPPGTWACRKAAPPGRFPRQEGARGLADRRTFVLRRKGGKLSSRSLGPLRGPQGLRLRRSRAPPLTSPQRGDAIEPWAPLTSPRRGEASARAACLAADKGARAQAFGPCPRGHPSPSVLQSRVSLQ